MAFLPALAAAALAPAAATALPAAAGAAGIGSGLATAAPAIASAATPAMMGSVLPTVGVKGISSAMGSSTPWLTGAAGKAATGGGLAKLFEAMPQAGLNMQNFQKQNQPEQMQPLPPMAAAQPSPLAPGDLMGSLNQRSAMRQPEEGMNEGLNEENSLERLLAMFANNVR